GPVWRRGERRSREPYAQSTVLNHGVDLPEGSERGSGPGAAAAPGPPHRASASGSSASRPAATASADTAVPVSSTTATKRTDRLASRRMAVISRSGATVDYPDCAPFIRDAPQTRADRIGAWYSTNGGGTVRDKLLPRDVRKALALMSASPARDRSLAELAAA